MFQSSELNSAPVISIAVAFSAGIVFVIVLAASWEGPEALRYLGWGAAAVAGVVVVGLLLKRVAAWFDRRELFSPFIAFPVAYTVWFGLGSLALFDDMDLRVLHFAALGLVCYLMGALLAGWHSALRSSRPAFSNEWEPSRFWSLMLVLAVAAAGSYGYIVSRIGIVALDPEAAQRRLDLGKYGAVQAILFSATWTILIFVVAQLWTCRHGRKVRLGAWLGLGVVALILLSLGSRGYLFVAVLTAVVARHYLKKRFHILKLGLLAIATFVALSFYGYFRDATLSEGHFSLKSQGTTQLAIFPAIYAYLYVRQPVETLQDVIRVIPRTIPYQNGMLTFDALRTLLPGHHEMSDMFFKQILGSDFVGGGQPATLLGPLYGDFGVLGIAVGLFATGVIIARTHSWMLANPTVFRVLIYAWLMQTILFSLFGALIPYITTLWIPLFWWFLDSALLHSSSFALRNPNEGEPQRA